ncbi:hypothetical protein HYV30_01715 [Candidatus Kaiserbacteria bacterium]|nr:hypothetical protein [Candidatus Kaiserbacteria bacterium]
MRHHAFVIEAEAEAGIAAAKEYANNELRITNYGGNPDVVILKYGLLSVEEARRIAEIAAGKPFAGEHKVVIIAASRVYHEAQNALLKVFEEPPPGTYLFLVLPATGSLLPTLRSRVQILQQERESARMIYHTSTDNADYPDSDGYRKSIISGPAEEFMKGSKEKRSAIVKRLTSGKDEEERRELRDEALAIVNGIEAASYAACEGQTFTKQAALLSDIAILRGYLHDRSAPVKMILEHLSIVTPDVRGKG